MAALAPRVSLRMASESNSHVDRLEVPPEELRNLFYAFHKLSPQQTLLIERVKAGVFDTPAAEHVVGRASSKSVRPKRSVARQQLLSPKEAQLILPLVVYYANGLTQMEIAKKHGMHVQTLRKRLHEAGINTRGRVNALSEADLRSAQAAVSDGASTRATACRLGVAHTTLQRALRRADA